jgi:glucose 1-dehydrogenase
VTRLAGKAAIVTGAANGIGHACARRLAADGSGVALADIDAPAGEAAAAALRAQGANAIFVATDVTKREAIEALVERAVAEFGRLDIMLNNAGVAPTASVLEMSDELFDKVLSVNLHAAFIGTQLAAREMVASGRGGVIINMSSVNALLAIPGLAAYACTKGALNQLTKVAAVGRQEARPAQHHRASSVADPLRRIAPRQAPAAETTEGARLRGTELPVQVCARVGMARGVADNSH